MNKFKLFSTPLLLMGFVWFFPASAVAADLNIECPTSPTMCIKSGLDPLFSNSLDGLWYPGKTITKSLNLKNSDSTTKEMVIRGTRTSVVNSLENVIHISLLGGNKVIWSGSVTEFYNQEKVGMGTFVAEASLDYDFTVYMASGAGDEYQNKETVFDLTLGFWGEPVPTATPTPISISGDSGDGDTLTTGVSAPVCSDVRPGTPSSFAIATGIGLGAVNLSWSSPSQPYTYFLVAYSDSPNWPPRWGNPNVGNTNSYTVAGLGTGTYWFWVRAGNGCATGDFVGPISLGATIGISSTGVADGFQDDVLGVESRLADESDIDTSASASTMVKGVKTINTCPFWWLVLVGQTIIICAYYFVNSHRKEWAKAWWLLTVGIVLVAYIIDLHAHTHWYTPSRYCTRELWAGTVLAIVETIIFRKLIFATHSPANI